MKTDPSKTLHAGSRPIVPGLPNPTCPILLEAKSVLDKARDLYRHLRKLRVSTQRCPTCPVNAECPTMRYFAHAVDSTLRDIRQEWGLDNE